MGFKPLHDQVLVQRVDSDTMTEGGILIPDSAQEKPLEGKVIAVGPGKRGEDGAVRPLAVAAGDRIIFDKYAGHEVKVDGVDLLVMREPEVLGIMEEIDDH